MKEKEWIVSPEELKRNQKRVLFEEEMTEEENKTTERRKAIISIILLILVLAFNIILISVLNKGTIDDCINAGNSKSFCIQAIG